MPKFKLYARQDTGQMVEVGEAEISDFKLSNALGLYSRDVSMFFREFMLEKILPKEAPDGDQA